MRTLWSSFAVLALGATAAFPFAIASGQRANCPGMLVCPLDGTEVCKDQCPLVDSSRTDCPGKIECPVTGELVCRDECPVGDAAANEADALPACCRGKS